MTNIHFIVQLTAALILFAGCTHGKNPGMNVNSNAFENNGLIPGKYTCDGDNVSPQIAWSNGPGRTKTYVLICDDPDAPSKIWVHWLIYNIPSTVLEIPENTPNIKGAVYGTNDFGKTAYGGPCPPDGTHHYHFKIYALDSGLSLDSGAPKEELESAMKGHILAHGELTGKYARNR